MRVFRNVTNTAVRHGVVSSVALGGGLVGLSVIGLTIGPARVFSGTTSSIRQPITSSELDPARSDIIDALKRLIEKARAIIDVRNDDDGVSELVLWIEDKRDPGVVNEDEVLILTYAPLLRAALALSVPPVDRPSPAMPTRQLFSDTLSLAWRRRSGVDQAVVATDVTAMRMEPIRRDAGETTLRISLTFANGDSDEIDGRRAEAMFVVTLPAVAHAR